MFGPNEAQGTERIFMVVTQNATTKRGTRMHAFENESKVLSHVTKMSNDPKDPREVVRIFEVTATGITWEHEIIFDGKLQLVPMAVESQVSSIDYESDAGGIYDEE